MIDYHLHTSRCCHATGTMEDYLENAVNNGLQEVGFADHFPLGLLGITPRAKVTMEPEELDQYVRDVEVFKKNNTGLKVKLGIEVDYIPGTEKKLEPLLKQYPFDYVIGSIHFMDEWDFTHPVYADTYKHRNIDELYRNYFKLVREVCLSGLFDIFGHIDVIKKFNYRPEEGLQLLWDETTSLLKTTGMAIEVNTAGRDAPVGEFYPDYPFLERCFRSGVPVTLGSDAHSPEQVGRYFPEAIELLKKAGYRELTLFESRKKNTIRLV